MVDTKGSEDFKNWIKTKSRKDFELLLPAGDLEKAKYAIEFGADAIYCGIPMFTMRGKSNMSMDDLREIIPYAHERGVRVYLAVNIFPHSFKYEQFLKDMKIMVEELKPDAFIMADPGLIDITHEYFPSAEIHLSVQQNNVNWMSARFWRKQGITRIVLARELTYPEVVKIHQEVPDIEIEFFIHGSNCMAYSGRCMLSNYMNYRDSNQGVCNNACRFEYKIYKSDDPDYLETLQNREGYKALSKGTYFLEEQLRKGELYEITEDENGTYILNSKDNCMVEYIEKLMVAGVDSYKVEGRTKSVYYASIVARTYRKIFDDILSGKKPDIDWGIRELNTTSNRGFMPGFLEGNPKDKAQDYEKKTSHQSHLFVGKVKNKIDFETKYKNEAETETETENENENENRIVDNFKKSILEIEVRGKFKLGDILEFVTPKSIFIWKCDNIINPKKSVLDKKRNLEKVSGGLEYNIQVVVPFKLDSKFCVIRRKLENNEIV